MKIGINGFGRIGRSLLRTCYEMGYKKKGIDIIAINSRSNPKQQAHLLKYDSVHGIFQNEVTSGESSIKIEGDVISVLNQPKPEDINWDVDIVFECSGIFNSKEKASRHKAPHVIVSAPVTDADQTIIYGVNHEILHPKNRVISCGSCTTNCLAPITAVIHEEIGIESGFMTTVHAYTNDQNVLDNTHKDIRRARSCTLSIIPTSTGAAKIIGEIIPSLSGKIDGSAVRVPVPNVSLIDFKFTTTRNTTKDEINDLMHKAAQNKLKNIVDISEEQLVSIDFTHNPHSAIFDPMETKVINNNFARVLAWYDNEWGFANRMLDIALLLKR